MLARLFAGFTIIGLLATSAQAHDTWVETNTPIIRSGDAVYVDLKLGNHGNHHRDFKLASKIGLDSATLEVIDPKGKAYDVKPRAVDTGYAPQEGFWRAKFATDQPGLYTVAHTLDKIVNHGRAIRSIKSGKTFFLVSDKLDDIQENVPGFEKPLGHALEVVPLRSTVAPMGPGLPMSVQLLFKGEPLVGARISFVPRTETLNEDFDERYERMTDENGMATFIPKAGDQYLVVAHHEAKDESSAEYEATAYSATLTVFVPELCPCCGQ
jgi:uncharacterized GH25 family protein